MSKVIAFIKSRPTEVWLGLWAAAVAVLEGAGVTLDPKLVAGVAALIGAVLTFVATKVDSLGPQ